MNTRIFERDGLAGLETSYPEFESCSPNYFEVYEEFTYQLLAPEYDEIIRADYDIFIVKKGEKTGLVRALCHELEWLMGMDLYTIEYPGGRFFLASTTSGTTLLHFMESKLAPCTPDETTRSPFQTSDTWSYCFWRDFAKQGIWVMEDKGVDSLDIEKMYINIEEDAETDTITGTKADGSQWMLMLIGERFYQKRRIPGEKA